MNVSIRSTSMCALAVALGFALLACKPLDKDTGKPVDGSGDDKAAPAVAAKGGLKTEKEQVSYVIGMQIGESLKSAKDEVDMETLVKSMKSTMDGKEPLLTQEEAMQVMQAFGTRMQAKQMAEFEEQKTKNASEGDKFLAENAKKPGVKTTASGLQYEVLTEGTGAKPKASDKVRVHYKGTLLDGTEFDSSYKRGEPAVLPLQGVIPGWAEGLQLMPVDAKYKFWIPSKLAYGEQAPPMIGPNQMLEFEVELLEIVKAPSGN